MRSKSIGFVPSIIGVLCIFTSLFNLYITYSLLFYKDVLFPVILSASLIPFLSGLACFWPEKRTFLCVCWLILFGAATHCFFQGQTSLGFLWDSLFLRPSYDYPPHAFVLSFWLNIFLIYPVLATLVSFSRHDELPPGVVAHRKWLVPLSLVLVLALDLVPYFVYQGNTRPSRYVKMIVYLLDWIQLALFVFLLVLCVEWIVSKCQRPDYKFPTPE